MNTSILDRAMLRVEARKHMLTQANLFYEAGVAELVESIEDTTPLEQWQDWRDSLNEVGRGALRQALAELPGVEIFAHYALIDSNLSSVSLSEVSDIRWAACSRGWMIDSAAALRHADFEAAYALADRATGKLFNVLSRARPTRMLDPLSAEQIQECLSLCDTILTALTNARRVTA